MYASGMLPLIAANAQPRMIHDSYLSSTTIPPLAHLHDLLLQARHIQPVDIPATRLALTMQHQRAHVSKDLAAVLIAAQERVDRAGIDPLSHEVQVGAAGADLRVHIDVHVKWRIPPFAETEDEDRGIGELGTAAGFEVVDQAGISAHGGGAGPAGDFGRGVFSHMLVEYQLNVASVWDNEIRLRSRYK